MRQKSTIRLEIMALLLKISSHTNFNPVRFPCEKHEKSVRLLSFHKKHAIITVLSSKKQGGDSMKIQESGENYLETILLLEMRNGTVRAVDIANELGFSKPSVTRAMGVLKKAGLVDQELYGSIRLTDAGRKRANEIYDRHVLIKEFLMTILSLDAVTAETDACRIEHIVSPLTIERMRAVLREKR